MERDLEFVATNVNGVRHRDRMGGWPGSIALDSAVGAFYVPDNVDHAVSLGRMQRVGP